MSDSNNCRGVNLNFWVDEQHKLHATSTSTIDVSNLFLVLYFVSNAVTTVQFMLKSKTGVYLLATPLKMLIYHTTTSHLNCGMKCKSRPTWDDDITTGAIDQYLPLWARTSGTRWVKQTHEVTWHSQAWIWCCGESTNKKGAKRIICQSGLRWERLVCLWKMCLFILRVKLFISSVLISVLMGVISWSPERHNAKAFEQLHTSLIFRFPLSNWLVALWSALFPAICSGWTK